MIVHNTEIVVQRVTLIPAVGELPELFSIEATGGDIEDPEQRTALMWASKVPVVTGTRVRVTLEIGGEG